MTITQASRTNRQEQLETCPKWAAQACRSIAGVEIDGDGSDPGAVFFFNLSQYHEGRQSQNLCLHDVRSKVRFKEAQVQRDSVYLSAILERDCLV